MEDMWNTIDYCALVQQKQLILELTDEAYEQGNSELGDYLDGVFRLLEFVEDAADDMYPGIIKEAREDAGYPCDGILAKLRGSDQ